MNILGKNVTLRAIEKEDLPLLHKWANDPEIWAMLGGWHFPSNLDYMDKWFANLGASPNKQNFAIDTEEHGLIGTVNLVDIDWKNNNAFTGLQLGDKDIRGKGYGIDTFMAIQRYAFEELHLNRLDGTVIEYNEPGLGFITKHCGWKEEGRQRGWYYRKNQYWDRIIVGITREDYFELIKKNNYWDE
ncbi:GNAT family N-acetyltransferase [Moheibacter sediminis]|uniref:Protein N-acetyltransferase, RimJ/RimL family n=1 Tax=Moheibacter sediminis TaxID=1434700 RepID=A0A1W1YXD6_9FLAO|nr:GNAT family protein [Moheibacter sediminis]SMC40742.1 Protein N-acetyltransferase, RimJ/RimL family [Moheibacter sediminis]